MQIKFGEPPGSSRRQDSIPQKIIELFLYWVLDIQKILLSLS